MSYKWFYSACNMGLGVYAILR